MSASFFRNSRDCRLESGTFITASNYINNLCSSPHDNEKAFDCLRENIAEEAIHNSDERYDAPKVHPETRKAVQEEIFGWITNGDDDPEPKKILWVSGPAGAGKTAIAGSIAELCEERGLLAGSFFFSSFSGSEKRRLKRFVVATLVYSILQHDSLQALRGRILSMIERDPAIFRKRLRDQCRILLLKPFHDAIVQLDAWQLPKVIIIDGLDEVESPNSRRLEKHEARLENEAEQEEILSALLQLALDANFPFRIVVVSRPERVIRDFFSNNDANSLSREIFLDEKYHPHSDISLFLNAKFAEIRRRYKMTHLWPREGDIKRLVNTASGQFIYAATVVRFLQSGKHPNPQALLRAILCPVCPDLSLDALSSLDTLYGHILMSSPDPPLAARWIGAIDSTSLYVRPASFTRQLLQDFPGQAEYLLENLSSLVFIPLVEDNESCYRFYHKSFVEFLCSARRCGPVLNDGYNAGPAFFCHRWFGVLQAKSPAVPIAGSEWQEFVEIFLQSISMAAECKELMEYNSAKRDLATCDVVGWVRVVDAFLGAEKQITLGNLSGIFHYIHYQCTEFGGPVNDCSDVCRHWRSCIYGECKRLGWNVPGPAVLLRERMWWRCGDRQGRPGWLREGHFQPPATRSQPSVPLPHATGEDVVRRKTYAEAYKALCALVDSIYQALPADWLKSYQKELEEPHGTDESATRKQLLRINPELRARMEGLEAWLSSSDGNEEIGVGSLNGDKDESIVEGSHTSQEEGGPSQIKDNVGGGDAIIHTLSLRHQSMEMTLTGMEDLALVPPENCDFRTAMPFPELLLPVTSPGSPSDLIVLETPPEAVGQAPAGRK